MSNPNMNITEGCIVTTVKDVEESVGIFYSESQVKWRVLMVHDGKAYIEAIAPHKSIDFWADFKYITAIVEEAPKLPDDIKLSTHVVMHGRRVTLACDLLCEKAWGIDFRPKVLLNEQDEDDYEWLADHELEEAPEDPGTYEGADGKPFHPSRHNKWCARQCERCVKANGWDTLPALRDFSERVPNYSERLAKKRME